MSVFPGRQPCRSLQLGAGLFLKGFEPDAAAGAEELCGLLRTAIADDSMVLGATAPGGSLRAVPEYVTLGAANDPSLTVLSGWTVLLTGTLVECSPMGLAALLGPSDITTQGSVTVVRPCAMLPQEELPSLCWVGETTAGLVLLQLSHALNHDGLILTFGKEEGSTAPFRFRAFAGGDAEAEDEVPFRIIFLRKAQGEEAADAAE